MGAFLQHTPLWARALLWLRGKRPLLRSRHWSVDDMERQVARFDRQVALRDRDMPLPVPAEVRQRITDMLGPRELFPIIGPASDLQMPAPGYGINGPDGFQLVIARCPPGNSPALHLHKDTTEIFVVLEGRFRISWGEHGQHSLELGRYDTILVPPNIIRTFTNTGDTEGIIMPIVLGGRHNLDEIVFTPAKERELEAEVGQGWVGQFKALGARFDAVDEK
jgi:mannose-6-phosphate isomerase-like protein (cupin superfamily)